MNMYIQIGLVQSHTVEGDKLLLIRIFCRSDHPRECPRKGQISIVLICHNRHVPITQQGNAVECQCMNTIIRYLHPPLYHQYVCMYVCTMHESKVCKSHVCQLCQQLEFQVVLLSWTALGLHYLDTNASNNRCGY